MSADFQICYSLKITSGEGPKCINGCNYMVLGAITMKFGMMKHKKMFSRVVKNF